MTGNQYLDYRHYISSDCFVSLDYMIALFLTFSLLQKFDRFDVLSTMTLVLCQIYWHCIANIGNNGIIRIGPMCNVLYGFLWTIVSLIVSMV